MSEPVSKVQAVANLLNVPLEKFAADVFGVCAYIESNGNSGYELTHLISANAREDVNLELNWMNSGVLGDSLDGICFYSKPSRHSDFSGWYVKRRPEIGQVWAWRAKWLETFGADNEIGKAIQESLVKAENVIKNTPQREHKRSSLETVPTVEIAHMWAASMILCSFFYGEFGEGRKMANASRDFQRWIASVWVDEALVMFQELQYRTIAQPRERESKTKTNAARADFLRAKDFIAAGPEGIYSKAYHDTVIKSAFPFDLGIDYERLPEPAPEEKLIRHMSESELFKEFIRYLDEDFDPNSFEYEDRQLLVKNLRKQLARLKGQKVEKE